MGRARMQSIDVYFQNKVFFLMLYSYHFFFFGRNLVKFPDYIIILMS